MIFFLKKYNSKELLSTSEIRTIWVVFGGRAGLSPINQYIHLFIHKFTLINGFNCHFPEIWRDKIVNDTFPDSKII